MTFRFLRYTIFVMQRQLEYDNNNLLVVMILVLFFKIKLRYILIGHNLLDCFLDLELARESVYIQGDSYWLISRQFRAKEDIIHRYVILMEMIMKHIYIQDILKLS